MFGRWLNVKQPAIHRAICMAAKQGLGDVAEWLVIQIATVSKGVQVNTIGLATIVLIEALPILSQFGVRIVLDKVRGIQDSSHILHLDRFKCKRKRGRRPRRKRKEGVIFFQEILRPITWLLNRRMVEAKDRAIAILVCLFIC